MTAQASIASVPREGQRPESRTPQKSSDRRMLLRWSVQVPVRIHRLWHGRSETMIRDISAGGCRIESMYPLPVGECVFITAPDFAPFPAQVVWSSWNEAGLRFARPLHRAVVGHLVRRWQNGDAEFRIA